MQISVIVLASDSHVGKGSSVLHALHMIAHQSYAHSEIIVVENSADKSLLSRIKETLQAHEQAGRIQKGVLVEYTGERSCRGGARNMGAAIASGEVLVFFDDDTVLLQLDALERIAAHAQRQSHGYGAMRLWTQGNAFQDQAEAVLESCTRGDTSLLRTLAQLPEDGTRGEGDVLLLTRSFIGNVGFIAKDLYMRVGGFPEYTGYGFEDDCLMFRLFHVDGPPALLSDVHVVHVNHPIKRSDDNTALLTYHRELITAGYYWFHVRNLFLGGAFVQKSGVLEPLDPLHYDHRIEHAWKYYIDLAPLNVEQDDPQTLAAWKRVQQYTFLAYARVLHTLLTAPTLDAFVARSGGDMDNLAPVIDSAIRAQLLSLNSDGSIVSNLTFRYTQRRDAGQEQHVIPPRADWNQFPCDHASVQRRVDLLKRRYPYAEHLSVGVIGDDDLLTLALANEYWVWPTVVEVDPRITELIEAHVPRAQLIQADVRKLLTSTLPAKLQTFITDPPYTLNGALAFIATGVAMLQPSQDPKEFYVYLNETMMGAQLPIALQRLADCGITLVDIEKQASQYTFPESFDEKRRAHTFLKQMQVDAEALRTSSSSHLYVFQTTSPDIQKLIRGIDPTLLYTHLV